MLQENLNPSDSPILQEPSPKFGSQTQVADSQEGKSVIVQLSESGNIMKESFSGKVGEVKTALEKWRQPKSQILPRYMPTGSVRRKTPRKKIEHKKKWSSISRVLFVLGSGCLVAAALVGASYFVSEDEVYMTRELAMFDWRNLWPFKSGKSKSGQSKSGQPEPEQSEPGQSKPGQSKPGQSEPEQSEPGQFKPEQSEVKKYGNVGVRILYNYGLKGTTYSKSKVTWNLDENTLQIEGKKGTRVLTIGKLNYDKIHKRFTGLTDETKQPVYLKIDNSWGGGRLNSDLQEIVQQLAEAQESS